MCDETRVGQAGEQADMPRTMRGAMVMTGSAGTTGRGNLQPTEVRQLEMQIEDRELRIRECRLQKEQIDLTIDELRVRNRRDEELVAMLKSIAKEGNANG